MLSSRSTWRYKMMAGAPGAWGSPVILSSACEMGWKPRLASACRAAKREIAQVATRTHLDDRNIVVVLTPEIMAAFGLISSICLRSYVHIMRFNVLSRNQM